MQTRPGNSQQLKICFLILRTLGLKRKMVFGPSSTQLLNEVRRLGFTGTIKKLFFMKTIKVGSLVGVDQFGNQYSFSFISFQFLEKLKKSSTTIQDILKIINTHTQKTDGWNTEIGKIMTHPKFQQNGKPTIKNNHQKNNH